MDGKQQVLLSFLARLKEFLDCKNILPILRFLSRQDVVDESKLFIKLFLL